MGDSLFPGILRVKREGHRMWAMGIVIVQTGTAGERMVAKHGDYPQWFMHAVGRELPVIRAHEGEKLDGTPQGIIVTGSPLSVMDRAPWMLELGEELLRASERGSQVLGVCFGHQLIGKAAGGEVILNPRGREIGTVEVQLTAAGRADPLFDWVSGGTFEALATHVDAVDPLPSHAVLLASNEKCAAQAFRLSETLAGVQFHPEASASAIRELIGIRADRIRAEGGDPEALAAGTHEVAAGEILRSFARLASKA
jgi:GMP synthase (glutamine-hydrolysing)